MALPSLRGFAFPVSALNPHPDKNQILAATLFRVNRCGTGGDHSPRVPFRPWFTGLPRLQPGAVSIVAMPASAAGTKRRDHTAMAETRWQDFRRRHAMLRRMQAAIVGIAGPILLPEEAALLRRHPPAGAILFSRNIQNPPQLAALIASLRRVLPRNAVLMVDQEGGRVARLRPPHWRAQPPAAALGRLFAADRRAGLRAAFLTGALIGLDCRRNRLRRGCRAGNGPGHPRRQQRDRRPRLRCRPGDRGASKPCRRERPAGGRHPAGGQARAGAWPRAGRFPPRAAAGACQGPASRPAALRHEYRSALADDGPYRLCRLGPACCRPPCRRP